MLKNISHSTAQFKATKAVRQYYAGNQDVNLNDSTALAFQLQRYVLREDACKTPFWIILSWADLSSCDVQAKNATLCYN